MTPLLSLMRLVSPALPVGGFSYSRGLEQAVEADDVRDLESARAWSAALLARSLSRLDLPALIAAYRAFERGDLVEVDRVARMMLALRESAEFIAEERNMGEALCRLLIDLQVEEARRFARTETCSFTVLFALAAQRWDVSLDDTLMGYSYVVCEGQVSAAVRLIPLGQTDGQRMLQSLCEQIPAAVATAKQLPEEDWGSFVPGLALASALHEQQYARLFRS